MNKKILALLMALMMVLTSVVAFADEETTTTPTQQTVTAKTQFDLTKTYTGDGAPSEEFTFVATAVTANAPALTLSNGGKITDTGSIKVTVPTVGDGESQYPATPAVYKYTISETAGKTLGTTYDSTVYDVTVTVYNAAAAGADPDYKTTIAIKAQDENTKTDEAAFTNEYENSGKTLVVKKQLAGNAAVMTDTFTIEVTFGVAEGVDKELKSTIDALASDTENVKVEWNDAGNVATITGIGHDDTVTFSNLPVNATWSVTETVPGEYTATYDSNQTGTMADSDVQTVVTNTKTTTIDTGVDTDNMPYFMLMAFVMIIAAAVVLKKRTVNE